jgi:SAM-dependent methyltransferase
MFVEPEKNIDIKDCEFYHKVRLDDGTIIDGDWDLTECIDDYLSNFDFAGKRVIDVGTASGYLSFIMEKKGAEVVSFDMPDGSYWDHLIYPGYQKPFARQTKRMFNSYYYLHEIFQSKNKIYRANIYERLGDTVGEFDVAVFGTMLSHVRDPILVLMNILYRVKGYGILINPFPDGPTVYNNDRGRGRTWWHISQNDVKNIMKDLGFDMVSVTKVYPVHDNIKRPYKSILFKRFEGYK